MFTKYIPENFEFEMFVEHLSIGTKGEAEGILINESVIEAMDDVADEDVSNSDDGDDDDMGDDDKLFVLEYYLVLPFWLIRFNVKCDIDLNIPVNIVILTESRVGSYFRGFFYLISEPSLLSL